MYTGVDTCMLLINQFRTIKMLEYSVPETPGVDNENKTHFMDYCSVF